ncbi:MAG: ATPase [Candidatus Binatia bacterium]|nr:MAG: ATPase [Candidatus Binatia bacterium]
MADLARELERLDGRPYPAYRDLRGRPFPVGSYRIVLDHVQGDPFASPSRVRVEVPPELLRLPSSALSGRDARRAAADFFHRRLLRSLREEAGRAGSGKSGLLEICPVGQEVLERTAVRLEPGGRATLRLLAGLPAAGRRILGREAARLLTEKLPRALDRALLPRTYDAGALARHVAAVEDQTALRAELDAKGLVAFLAEGAILPRKSGADDRPMEGALPLEVSPSLAVELEAPHAGRLRGLGIPRGVTLIVGGGYHGKSTLLAALASGVYDHVPGDGREFCVTVPGAVVVRAEDGRSVRGVDLRAFISRLPLGRPTDRFETDDASGSTSQAAAILEALEVGATCLLVDEDTAATNFMIRDARMRRLVPPSAEPITPYIDRVRQLARELGVSSVLVVGGAGDYLDVADTVIQMQDYRPLDVTEKARQVARELPLGEAAPHPPGPWPSPPPRVPDPRSFDPSRGRREERVRSVKTRSIEFGTEEIDVSLLAQLVDPAQCRAIGDVLLLFSRGLCDGKKTLAELLDLVDRRIEDEGLESVTQRGFGDRARPRRFEIAGAVNRLRTLRIR